MRPWGPMRPKGPLRPRRLRDPAYGAPMVPSQGSHGTPHGFPWVISMDNIYRLYRWILSMDDINGYYRWMLSMLLKSKYTVGLLKRSPRKTLFFFINHDHKAAVKLSLRHSAYVFIFNRFR